MPDTAFTIDVADVSALETDEGWWAVFDSSFPREERETRQTILRRIRDAAGVALRAREDGKTVGIGLLHLLRESRVGLLLNVAVAEGERGHHIGSALVREAARMSSAAIGEGARGMVWEVELPVMAEDPAERAVRQRRLEFYRHLGAELLDHPYILPPLWILDPMTMGLMFLPAPGSEIPEGPEIAAIIREMYGQYGKYDRIDPGLLSGLLAEIGIS